ncbi:hypothetical protein NADFUDRAFT_49232 [Nadsonia fulvescens var. elongata DSM 6958]|uniref:Elongator complex protein 6 n=1 Tax=Nadsonia fulvescens var. elongata DSM 6958 TaxID=857566 RepID=A0A1E3PTK5_9ASCO|nr:hypothetical protein NADFUDRAFT_49232 [Nadsonia fulvescens var. elongata DSM 6958]
MTAIGSRGFPINELSFFQVSPSLIPSKGNIILTTSTLEVSPIWLIHHIIQQTINSDNKRKIVLVSLLQDKEFHEKQLRKFGIELKNPKYSSKLQILDNFSNLDLNQNLKCPSSFLTQLARNISSDHADNDGPIVLIENLDFLLTAASVTASDLLYFITDLQFSGASTLLFCNADVPLIMHDQTSSSGQPPIVDEQGQFLFQLLHRSVITISLRPLKTGRADDITGVLRVSNGGKPLNYAKSDLTPSSTDRVLEKEYLYLLNSDTSIRLFYR